MAADFPTIIYLLVTGMVMLELLAAGMKQNRIYYLFVNLRTLTCLAGSLNWLGDSWQWSKGFFKASILKKGNDAFAPAIQVCPNHPHQICDPG